MATNEFFDIIGILLGFSGAAFGLSSFLAVRRRRDNETGKGRGVLLPGILFIMALLLLVVIIAASLFGTSGPDSASIAIVVIAVFSSLAGAFAVIQILNQRTLIIQIQKAREELERESDRYLQMYKDRARQDRDITQIHVLGMTVPVEVSDVYIKLKVRQCNAMESMQYVAQNEQENSSGGEPESVSLLDETFDLNPIKFIAKHHCVILGDPGSGKTTLLQHLSLLTSNKWFEQSVSHQTDERLPVLPVYIKLHDFASFLRNKLFQQDAKDVQAQGGSLFDFICKKWKDDYGFVDEEEGKLEEHVLYFLPMFMERGDVLLLLDGLDEVMTGPDPRECYGWVIKAIQELAERYTKLRIVITARKATYFQQERFKLGEASVAELEILPFGLDDISTFVRNWFRDQPQPLADQEKFDSQELIEGIERIPRVRELVSNPLFLLVIVFAYDQYKRDQHKSGSQKFDLTRHRADLYRRCVNSFDIWDASRGISRPISRSVKDILHPLLERVAYQFQLKGVERLAAEDVIKLIAGFLRDEKIVLEPEEVLNEIATSNGLLKRSETGQYQFLHQRFQEYFAARYFFNHEDGQDVFDTIGMYDPWWSEVVMIYAAFAGRVRLRSLLKELSRQNEEGDDFFLTPLILAGHCLAARSNNSSETNDTDGDWRTDSLGRAIINRLFKALRETPYSLTRDRVAKTLVDIEGDSRKKEDNEEEGNNEGEEDNEEEGDSIQKFLEPLPADKQGDEMRSRIRLSIARALNTAYDMELPDRVLSILEREDSLLPKEIKEGMAQALGELAMPVQFPKMIELLSDSGKRESLRLNMAYALSYTRSSEVARNLFSQLSGGEVQEEGILQAIVTALGKLSETSQTSQAHDLCRMLSNKKLPTDVRRRIAEVIGKLDNLDVVPALLSLLTDAQLEDEVRCAIASALSDMHVRSSTRALRTCYTDEKNPQIVRDFIATTLCRLEEDSATPGLSEGSVIPRLQELLPKSTASYLESKDEGTRNTEISLGEEIAAALGTVNSSEIQLFLRQNLMNRKIHRRVRVAIARALGRRGAEREALLQILRDGGEDGDVRRAGALALGDVQDPSVIPELLDVLQDKEASVQVRLSAAKTIEFLVTRDMDSERLEQCARGLVELLNDAETSTHPDFADSVHATLWEVSRRLPKLRIIQMSDSSPIGIVSVP